MRSILFIIALFLSCLKLTGQCPTGSTFYFGQYDIDHFAEDYPNCTQIEGTLFIVDESQYPVKDLSGLSQLRGVTGSLIVRGCEYLKTLDGLDNIIFIGGNIQIEANDSLQALYAFNKKEMKSIQGDLWISDNPQLTTLEGFNYLENIYSQGEFAYAGLWIWDNPSLIHVNELNKLNNVGKGITITLCDNFQSLAGLSNMISIPGDLVVSHALLLKNLQGLENLQSIGGNLILNNTGLENMDALYSLRQIGGAIRFFDNESLTRIDGMSDVDPNSLQGDQDGYLEHIDISFNPLLDNCAIHSICNILQRPDITYYIAYNGVECSSYQEVLNNCSSVSVYEHENFRLDIYPNPTHGTIFISSDTHTTAKIHTLQGRLIKTVPINNGETTLNLYDLSSGTYLLCVPGKYRQLIFKY